MNINRPSRQTKLTRNKMYFIWLLVEQIQSKNEPNCRLFIKLNFTSKLPIRNKSKYIYCVVVMSNVGTGLCVCPICLLKSNFGIHFVSFVFLLSLVEGGFVCFRCM